MLARFLMIPREMKFYDLFEKSAGNLVVAAGKLVDLFDDYRDVEAKVELIKDLEHEGDAITHEIMQSLHRTFVTPIDREDIAFLANSLDDVMDFIEAAARSAFLYRVTQPTERVRELASIVLKVTYKLNEVMPLLRRRDQFKQILKQCVEINRLENEADDVHHAALAELFDNTRNVRDIIKWREIYEHMESATDRGEDVANVLEAVVLKHA
jgi:predicted phosphate transport protein (TIGR00153 family)